MGFNAKGILIFGIRRKKPSKSLSSNHKSIYSFADCPFDFYEILVNPIDYKVAPGDEALVMATDFSHA